MFKVLLQNEDYTIMEYVVYILMLVLHETIEEVTPIMLKMNYMANIFLCNVLHRGGNDLHSPADNFYMYLMETS